MTNIKALIAMAVTVAFASMLLLGGGWERVGQVALSVYACLICLVLFAKDDGKRSPLPIRVIGMACFAYVVVVSAYTDHLVIAFVLAIVWTAARLKWAAIKIEKEKSQGRTEQ